MKLFLTRIFVLLLVLASSGLALDREAFTITHYQLDVQIDRASHVMAVTGRIELRNDSSAPQKSLSLQVSSSLAWNGIAFNGKPVEWIANSYTSDIDHTGSLSEAVVTLPSPVPTTGKISLDLQYGGTIVADATRLTRLGAPDELALRNDWDQISTTFSAVRGLGNVVWYPVSIPAVSMSEGNTVVAAIDAWKFRHKGSQFDARLHVIAEDVKLCIAGTSLTAPCGAFGSMPNPRTEGMVNEVSNDIHLTGLGKTSPSFAIAVYVRLERPDLTIFHIPNQALIAREYAAAAEDNGQLLDTWLPSSQQLALVIELADPNANPFQAGAVLFTPLRHADQNTLSQLLIPPQVAARFPAPRPWIEDGLQRFMQAMNAEKRLGRKGALQFLNQYLPPLQKAQETAHAPGTTASESAANSLINTSDEILLRGKSGFVFWMLRDMLGDSVLQHALVAYRPAQDTSPAYLQTLLEEGRKRDLEWFFDDWVYRDRGLPDFHIESVYPRLLLENPNKLSLVTVTIENRGRAGAEVPVTLQAPTGEKTLRVLVPANQRASAREQTPEMPTRVVVNDGSIPVSDSSETVYAVPAKTEPR